jgi:hypothetical protein
VWKSKSNSGPEKAIAYLQNKIRTIRGKNNTTKIEINYSKRIEQSPAK